MLTGVAVVPGTPLLVPEVAGSAAGELDDLRAACLTALLAMAGTGADEVVVVGAGSRTGLLADDAYGDLRVLSLPEVGASLQRGAPGPPGSAAPGSAAPGLQGAAAARLSRPLVVGVRLLDEMLPDLPRRAAAVVPDATAEEALALGAALVDDPSRRSALLVVGDASAATVAASPAFVVPGAVPADREAARAVGTADLAAIAAWSPAWGEQFVIEGRAPWQVATGAALAPPGRQWRGALHHDAAPYGVTYLVATWT